MTPTCCYSGFKGNGKTVGMIERNLKTIQLYPETPIYSNCFINIENYNRLILPRIMETPNYSLINMDEFHGIIHARVSNTYISLGLAQVIAQLRKTGRMIYLSVQLIRTLDVIWRELLDYLVVCYRIPNGEDIWYYYDFGFEWHIARTGETITKIASYDFISKFFEFYDTMEVIPPRYWSRVEYDLYAGDWDLMTERAHDMAVKIKDNMKNQTKIETTRQLRRANFDPVWVNEVFEELQNIWSVEHQ